MHRRHLSDLITSDDTCLIGEIDHVNYAVEVRNERAFIETWANLGFLELSRVQTQKYAGTHIALGAGRGKRLHWSMMNGLAVSTNPDSPINRFIERHGAGVQYVAYSVNPEADLDEMYDRMRAWGWKLMTPVLSYEDSNGPRLREIYICPTEPYGPFIGFIQRLPGQFGVPYEAWDILMLDSLYDYYVEVSERLKKGN
jgi:hypothetical protein